MVEFFAADENFIFVVSLCLVLVVAVVEGVGLLLGTSVGEMIDDLIPDFGVPQADVPDVDVPDVEAPDIEAPDVDAPEAGMPGTEGSVGAVPGILAGVLGWLNIGKVPVLVVLIIFLASFGLFGLFLQAAVEFHAGEMMPALIAAVPSAVLAMVPVHYVGLALAEVVPREETYAVSSDEFVGRVATIIRGVARMGQPAEAKLFGPHGRAHYVRVEPASAEETFEAGSQVRLISRRGAAFVVVRSK